MQLDKQDIDEVAKTDFNLFQQLELFLENNIWGCKFDFYYYTKPLKSQTKMKAYIRRRTGKIFNNYDESPMDDKSMNSFSTNISLQRRLRNLANLHPDLLRQRLFPIISKISLYRHRLIKKLKDCQPIFKGIDQLYKERSDRNIIILKNDSIIYEKKFFQRNNSFGFSNTMILPQISNKLEGFERSWEIEQKRREMYEESILSLDFTLNEIHCKKYGYCRTLSQPFIEPQSQEQDLSLKFQKFKSKQKSNLNNYDQVKNYNSLVQENNDSNRFSLCNPMPTQSQSRRRKHTKPTNKSTKMPCKNVDKEIPYPKQSLAKAPDLNRIELSLASEDDYHFQTYHRQTTGISSSNKMQSNLDKFSAEALESYENFQQEITRFRAVMSNTQNLKFNVNNILSRKGYHKQGHEAQGVSSKEEEFRANDLKCLDDSQQLPHDNRRELKFPRYLKRKKQKY